MSGFDRHYFAELWRHRRPLAAASLGCSVSLPLFAYTNSVFAPHLIEQFGWSRAQFALISLTMLTTLPILALVGRLTDRLGVRRVALLGSVLVPLCFVGYAMQSGDFNFYVAVFIAVLAFGSMTGPLVYSRLIAQQFRLAQGLALTVMNCAPALLAIPVIPLLNWGIEAFGWREAFLGLGALVLALSLLAVWLTDPFKPEAHTVAATAAARPKAAREDYSAILASSVFWVIVVAMFLCLLQTQLHSSQMNLMIIDQGITKQTAAVIASVYAAGTIVGRVLCGFALDYCSTRMVTAVSMFIPAVGFAMLGSSFDSVFVVMSAMFLVGVSVGAESDLICFLVARYFKLSIYSTTLGLVQCVTFLASASGGIAVSFTLSRYDTYTPFLWVLAGAITAGSLLFLLLPRDRDFEKVG